MGPSTNIDGDGVGEGVAGPRGRASMGPSTNIDGDLQGRSSEERIVMGFNGAVNEHRRRRCRGACSVPSKISFNGAVDEHRRRQDAEQEVSHCCAAASM